MKCPRERGGQIPPLSRWRRYPSGVFTRWMLLLAVALLAPPGPGAGRAADAVPGLDEVPLSQLLEIVVAGRDLLAFDAHSGGQITKRLRLEGAMAQALSMEPHRGVTALLFIPDHRAVSEALSS